MKTDLQEWQKQILEHTKDLELMEPFKVEAPKDMRDTNLYQCGYFACLIDVLDLVEDDDFREKILKLKP